MYCLNLVVNGLDQIHVPYIDQSQLIIPHPGTTPPPLNHQHHHPHPHLHHHHHPSKWAVYTHHYRSQPISVGWHVAITFSIVGTDDEYEIGDLSGKYRTFLGLSSYSGEHVDYNLPLFGRNSIIGRSIVIHKNVSNARWVCANVEPDIDAGMVYFIKTETQFNGPEIVGMILIVRKSVHRILYDITVRPV